MIRALAVFAAVPSGAAHACGDAGDKVATGAHYAVAFRTAPSAIRIGEHFTLDFTVCPLGKAAMPRTVRVDASMPEHRHGMNYRPTIVAKGTGRYRAEGLLFHMGGRWEIVFDLAAGDAKERVVSQVVLE